MVSILYRQVKIEQRLNPQLNIRNPNQFFALKVHQPILEGMSKEYQSHPNQSELQSHYINALLLGYK